MIKWNRIKSWLLPGVLIFCMLGAVTIPAACFYTYSGRSETPDHILTYTPHKLTWDSATGINEDGIAEMDLFDGEYAGVRSASGENVIAPGSGKTNIVRLKNDADEPVRYVAVLYSITDAEALPLHVTLNGSNFSSVKENTVLPDGVSEDRVIAAVEGSVEGKQLQDLDVTWDWSFYKDTYHDAVDTALGNREELNHAAVGLYIQVEEDGESIIHPETPQTGDEMRFGPYITLMLIGAAAFAVAFVERKKDRKAE